MTDIAGFPLFLLRYDEDGALRNGADFAALQSHIATANPSDVIFISHGFLNDEAAAVGLYSRFLTSLRTNLQRPEFGSVAARTYAVAGVIWPSKKFDGDAVASDNGSVQSVGDDGADEATARAAAGDAIRTARDTIACPEQKPKLDQALALLPQLEGSPAKQKEFVSLVLSLTDDVPLDPSEGLDRLRAKDGAEVLDILSAPIILPTVASSGDGDGGVNSVSDIDACADSTGGAQGFTSFVGGIFGAVGNLMNVTTWYVMKNRAGAVGMHGVADAVKSIKQAAGAPKVHLVGHSLGGRLMAGCSLALADSGVHPDSLTLLEAAFSHFGFSEAGPNNPEGFFRDVITKNVVHGPIVETYSMKDSVVGLTYAIASRLASDNRQSIGDENDQYGGIGRNGAINCDVGIKDTLHQAGTAYGHFQAGKVLSLDGSAGLITGHSDVTNDHVTYAFASVLSST